MKVETKQTVDDENQPQNPRIPEDYYQVELSDIISYDRDDRDAPGLVFRFKVLDDVEIENDFDPEMTDREIIVPFFAPAKLSFSDDAESSRLTDNLIKLGLHDAVLEQLGFRDAVMQENKRVIPESDEDVDEFTSVLTAFLDGKVVKADVSYGRDENESQINKFSKVVESEESDVSKDSSNDGSESDNVILDGSETEEPEEA